MERDDPAALDDDALVATFQRDPGSEAGRRAAETLLLRWRERIYLWCHGILRDRELALDVTQECLVRAWRGLPEFGSRAAVSSWLFAIARNRCRSALRRRPLRRDPDVDMEELDGLRTAPVDAVAQREDLRRVLRAMESALDPLERRALWLRAYEGLHVDEITRVLKLDASSGARGVLQSARRKLRAALGTESGGTTP